MRSSIKVRRTMKGTMSSIGTIAIQEPAHAALKPLVHGLALVVDAERAALRQSASVRKRWGTWHRRNARPEQRIAYRPHASHTMPKNHALRVRLALIFACITG
jgi:hypothetical protein